MRKLLILALILSGCAASTEEPMQSPEIKKDPAIEFIKEYEGFKAEAYKCAGGRWTIGFGTKAQHKQKITKIEAEKLLVKHVADNIKVDADNERERIAFISYQYNTGKRIKSCDEILTRAGGFTIKNRWSAGLYKRRIAEYSVCTGVDKALAQARYTELTYLSA